MLRIFFKRRILKRQRSQLVRVYQNLLYTVRGLGADSTLGYFSTFSITLPKRQQFFTLSDFRQNKIFNFSAGRQLALFGRKAKFFKRSVKNIAPVVLQLKTTYEILFHKIYLFFIKNYSRRQMLFFKKFNSLIKPGILYLVHKQSYIPKFSPIGRVKRKILRIVNQK
jgi:hypothetical protein